MRKSRKRIEVFIDGLHEGKTGTRGEQARDLKTVRAPFVLSSFINFAFKLIADFIRARLERFEDSS